MAGSTVKTSERFEKLLKTDERVLGKACKFVLQEFLLKYVPRTFADLPWKRKLSPRYAAYKRSKGRQPIADLYLTGKLRRAATTTALRKVKIEGATATTRIDNLDYAITHVFGLEGNPVRDFWDITRYKTELKAELKRVMKSALTTGYASERSAAASTASNDTDAGG